MRTSWRVFCGLVALSAWGCGQFSRSAPSGPLTTAAQVRQLTPEQVAAQAQVHLRGTVTYVDGPIRLVIVEDSTGAVRVEDTPAGLQRGASVDLQGTVLSGGSDPTVASGSVRVVDRHGAFLAPARPDAQDLASGRRQYCYVEIEGVVRSAILDQVGRLSLVVHSLGRDVQVAVRDQSAFNYHSLVDAVVRARGEVATSLDVRGLPIDVKLWVTALDDVQVLKPAPPAAEAPLRTVRSLHTGEPTPDRRIRLHGAVSIEAGHPILRDSTGAIALEPAPSESIEAGHALDVLCFVDPANPAPALTSCAVWDGAPEQRSPAPLPLLTAIRQVKELSADQARLAYPVHLRAVITYCNPLTTTTFAQDETGGIYLFLVGQSPPALNAGDLVEIEGFSGPGQFAPVVAASSLRVVGRKALPAPLRVDMERLFTGVADGVWVEAEGVVHSIRRQAEYSTLGVNWGSHHYSAYVCGATQLPDSLLDSHIRVLGVSGARCSFKGHVVGMQMYVPDAGFIRVEGSAPPTPPLQNISQLLDFSSASHFGERTRVRGVVTLTGRTGPTYVSDPTGGVLIQDHQAENLKVGDSVEVTGFPVAIPGLFNPVLRDAGLVKLGHPGPPEPRLVAASDILNEGYDAQLIRIDAVLVDQGAVQGGQALVLQAGNRLFEARLDQQRLPALDRGSLLRVTGVTSLQAYESQQTVLPRAFSILLRSPADVVVLEPAPWWTAARTFRVLGFVCALALAALAWIVVLRRRVRQQTADLRGSRQMLQLVLDHIPQGVFWKDRQGRFLGCNQACATDAGVPTPRDMVGKTVYDVPRWRAKADLYTADDRQVMDSGQDKIGYEEPLTGANGEQRWARTSKVPLPGSIGGVIGVLGTYEDITEARRAEEKLQRYSVQLAETNEELRRFTQIVSHDLRAPLVSLKGFSIELRKSIDTLHRSEEAFLANLPEPERAAVAEALKDAIPEALGFVESSVTRMDHLTQSLLRLSRAGHREFHTEDLDAAAMLRDIVASLAHQIESRHIAVAICPLPHLSSDRDAIEQIFGNLLDNAIKYLDPQRLGQIEVSAEESAEAVFFHVRDNGRGIAEDDMDKVFAPFRRAGAEDVPGEGMGLAFVRTLLNRLGGRIECHSQLGVGTTFSFWLPKVI